MCDYYQQLTMTILQVVAVCHVGNIVNIYTDNNQCINAIFLLLKKLG